MAKPALSETQRVRLEKVFREAFGRELTPDERKFLGLSVAVEPPDEDETTMRQPADEDDEDLPFAKKASA
jgi:hypothetical protein